MTKSQFSRNPAVLGICLVVVILCFSGCQGKNEYTPTGAFYVKTSPARGDRGVEEVLSLEAPYKAYDGEGDITVSMTAGLGHLPGQGGYDRDIQDTFYVLYRIIPGAGDTEPAWEKKVSYTDSFYDTKYDSTVPHNRPFLFVPNYGEFYPQYKENVDIVFPEDIQKGRLYMAVYCVVEGREDHLVARLDVCFERTDGVLNLAPQN